MKIKPFILATIILLIAVAVVSCDPCWVFKNSHSIKGLVEASPKKTEYKIGDTINFSFVVDRKVDISNPNLVDDTSVDEENIFDIISETGITEAGFYYYGFDVIRNNRVEVVRGVEDKKTDNDRLGTVIYDEVKEQFVFDFRVIIEEPGAYDLQKYSEFQIQFNEDKKECENYFFITTTVEEKD